MADDAATARGMTLGGGRREVLAEILGAGQPLTAYQILDRLQRTRGKPVMPPTVYRAADFLVKNGFIHRLESLNAFVACSDLAEHGSPAHSGQFVICNDCGHTEELHDAGVGQALGEKASALGYSVQQQIVELRGLCQECRGP